MTEPAFGRESKGDALRARPKKPEPKRGWGVGGRGAAPASSASHQVQPRLLRGAAWEPRTPPVFPSRASPRHPTGRGSPGAPAQARKAQPRSALWGKAGGALRKRNRRLKSSGPGGESPWAPQAQRPFPAFFWGAPLPRVSRTRQRGRGALCVFPLSARLSLLGLVDPG